MTAQAGICAEPNLHAYYLMFDIKPDAFGAVRAALAELPALWQTLQQDYPDAAFTGLVAVGNEAWDELYPAARPAELVPFPAQQEGQGGYLASKSSEGR